MNYRLLLTCGASILGTAVSAQLQAQEIMLEEIIVTAQKRVETAQEIPLVISVMNADALLSEGIKDMQDIYKTAPSVTANVRGGGQNVAIGIRGMQQSGTSPTSDPLVAVHLDGAYLASTWGLSGMMYDLDRVEVLEGPQGTLYGRNATAGTINLITKRPGKNFEGNASFDIGDYHSIRLQAGVSVPVSDSLSFRFAGLKYTRNSLYTVGDQESDQWGTRLSTVWTPTNADELFVSLDYNKFDSASDAGTLIGINPAAPAPSGAQAPAPGTSYVVPNDPYDNKPYWTARGTVYTGNKNDQRQWGVNAQYKHEFEAFSTSLIYSHRDIDGVSHGATKRPTAFSENLTVNKMKSDSAELRFVSTAKTPLEWVGGLFYFKNSNEGFFAAPIGPYGGRANAAALQAQGPTSNTIAGTTYVTPVGLPADACPCGGGLFSPSNGTADSYAAYGQGTWTPSGLEDWHFVLGLRYSHDKKTGDLGTPSGVPTFDSDGAGPLPAGYFSRVIAQETWNGVQWKVGANYDVSNSSKIYTSIATGYKAGGFGYGPTPLIEPEQVLAFEVGSKNRFLNNTLQLNGAVWYYDYTDLEASYPAPLPTPVTGANGAPITTVQSVTNMGKAHLGGASVDLEWLFTDADRFGLDATYVYSKVIDGKAKANGTQLFKEGERFSNTPEFAFTARYGHTFTLGSGATLLPQLKYRWQSERYDPSVLANGVSLNKQYASIPSTGILDATLKYAPAGDAWDVTAYVYNVTDELDINILQYGQPGVNQPSGHQLANLGDPRLFGLIFSMRF